MADLDFEGRVAIITGAGGGLGRAHARVLASRGAQIVVNDLGGAVDGTGSSAGPAETVVAEIQGLGGAAVADTHSVVDPDGAASLVKTALAAFGRVDIVVNNAGILRDKSFHNMTQDLWDDVVAVHLTGAFNVTRAAWAHFRDQNYGRIVSTSSAAGIFGNFGQANYGAAKMGIVGLTRAWAQEGLKYNIKANAVAPIARTRMTEDLIGPLAEKFDPSLVSSVVTYLASEGCPVSGEIYSAGGGRAARIFIAECPGYFAEGLTAEDVRDNWDAIRAEAGYVVPGSARDEVALLTPFLSDR